MSDPELWDGLALPDDPQSAEQLPNTVTMFEPLEVFMDRLQLLQLVETSLQTLNDGAKLLAPDPDRDREITHARRQREELLAWLAARPGQQLIFTALYPTTEFEHRERPEA